ncbi:MAG: hypothetical protein J6D30_02310 [Clostridia bacterium]|nr:hypothetical protein [Clostridia bacterium]
MTDNRFADVSADIIYDVTKEELTAQLKATISEFFVGVCTEEKGGLTLALVNGQKFHICVTEVEG